MRKQNKITLTDLYYEPSHTYVENKPQVKHLSRVFNRSGLCELSNRLNKVPHSHIYGFLNFFAKLHFSLIAQMSIAAEKTFAMFNYQRDQSGRAFQQFQYQL